MKNLGEAEVLRETRERLRTVQASDLALWGRMSVAEMVLHLGQAYEVALGERIVGPVKGPLPKWANKFLALRSPMQWPKGFKTTPELEVAMKTCPEVEFGQRIDHAVAGMEAVASGERWAACHAFFGAMDAADWMRWGYLHADHHLRQFGR